MRNLWAKRLAAAAVSGAILSIGSVANAADIRILPVDTAKFWAGATFDFDVEVAKASDLKVVSIQVNGKDAGRFFGKKLERKDLGNGVVSFRANGVSFPRTGSFQVTVKASDASGDSKQAARYTVVKEASKRRAKNVILFVGDGMSLPMRQIARIMSKGMTNGKYNDRLAMEKLPNNCLITTSGYDSLTTDSANSASAYATGHKSVVNAMGVYEDSTKDPLDDPRVENLSEILKRTRGMSVGVVTQAESTDATPAAMIGHTRRRAYQDVLAKSYLEQYHRPDVIMGGGLQRYIPQSAKGSKRKDDFDVVAAFRKLGYTYVTNATEMKAAPGNKPLLGLYYPGTMNVWLDREMLRDPKVLKNHMDQPNLVDMTKKSLEILSKNKNGFFAMIEGASIDKQLHAMDWQRAGYDTIEFDKAVEYARDWSLKRGDDTLIIVVADHAHGISITGTYHERDGKKGTEAVRTYANSIFPTFVDTNKDGFPDNPDPEVTIAVQYANHPAFYENYHFMKKPTKPTLPPAAKDKASAQKAADKAEFHLDQELANGARANPARHHEGDPEQLVAANIPVKTTDEVHAADDVPLNAGGPGSEYFKGVMDNTEVYFGILRALGIDGNRTVKKLSKSIEK
ncbi:MAG: alkaline phosphatase [Sutterellaceae bacterium]|nr:alkaline phosphatase [Sutterellaceae bacterium]MDD7442314.1 alkaline phosphatase [Sutterellaceae bacterium]MDY2868366.1 alkaline phosphatase [Mesosutterella sp.]